eukprot:6191222-Pleurochrysis_carterae.AAC.3
MAMRSASARTAARSVAGGAHAAVAHSVGLRSATWDGGLKMTFASRAAQQVWTQKQRMIAKQALLGSSRLCSSQTATARPVQVEVPQPTETGKTDDAVRAIT